MDYIGLINRFWSLNDEQGFDPAQTHLYFFMLKLFNSKGQGKQWPESIQLSDGSVCLGTGFQDAKTLARHRKALEGRGLLQVDYPGSGNRSGQVYRLTTYGKNPEVKPTTYGSTSGKNPEVIPQVSPQPTDEPTEQPRDSPTEKIMRFYIYKEYQTPNRETLNKIVCVAHRDDASVRLAIGYCLQHKKPRAAQKKAPPSVAPPQFPGTWTDEMCRMYLEDWLPYYRRRTGRNMTIDSRRLQIEKLSVLNEAELKACLESSISNNYQGVFPDKFKQRREQRSAHSSAGNQRSRNGSRQSLAETGSEIDRLAEEYFGPQH